MNDFTAARKRLYLWAKELHEVADEIDEESGDLLGVRVGVLEQAALIADQVEATARPGDGKDAAAEIGRRIRALMGDGAMSDIPPKTYPPEFLRAMIADHEAEQAGQRPRHPRRLKRRGTR